MEIDRSITQIDRFIRAAADHAQERAVIDKEGSYTYDALRFYSNFGSIIFFVGLTLPRYRFSKPSASLDMNLRQCIG